MARARNIKPGFFANEILAECDPLARLLFAGLWTIADREGRLEDRPKRIRAEILPYDMCDADALLDQLARGGFIVRYEAGGARYIQIAAWAKHQNPHVKEAASTIPAPCESGASPVSDPENPEAAGLDTDSLPLIPDSKVSGQARATAADFAKAGRAAGIDCAAHQPQVIELAKQGLALETFVAACTEAKAKASDPARIPINFVVAILNRWARQAQAVSVSGAVTPAGAKDAARQQRAKRESDAFVAEGSDPNTIDMEA